MRVITFIDEDLKLKRMVFLEDGDVYKTRSRVYDVVRYEGNYLFKCGRCSVNNRSKVCRRIKCNGVVLIKRD